MRPKTGQFLIPRYQDATVLFTKNEGVIPMAQREKHMRITDQAWEVVKNRDRKKFPTERDFINEAILSYADRIEIRELVSEFKALKRITEKLYKTVGWQ